MRNIFFLLCIIKLKNSNVLTVELASKSSADQRAGRAGRVRPGVCYRLYSEKQYSRLPARTDPEILRMHLGQALLQLLRLGILSPLEFDFVEKPENGALQAAYIALLDLDAVDEIKKNLTQDGLLMANLPFEPALSKFIIDANRQNVGYEGIPTHSRYIFKLLLFFRFHLYFSF